MSGTLFQLSSGSDVDKDTLIDEMQEKIGELLKCNQDLCDARNQNEILKEQIAQMQKQFKIEKIALEDEIAVYEAAQHDSEQYTKALEQQVATLTEENKSLKGRIEDMKNEIQDIHNSSEEELKQQVLIQTSQFKTSAEIKDRKIAELMAEIQELKNTNTENMNALVKQAKDCDKCSDENQALVRENASLKRELASTQEIIDDAKQKLKMEKEQRKLMQEKIEQVNREKAELADAKVKLQAAMNEKNDLIQDLQSKVSSIKALDAQAESFEALAEFLEKKIKQASTFHEKYNKLKKQHKKLLAQMMIRDKQIEEAAVDLSGVQVNAVNLQKRANELDLERNRLDRLVQKLQLKVKIGKVVAKSNHHLMSRVQAFEAAVEPQLEPPSLRSIVIASLMLRRWRNIVGTPKVYEEDLRSWWWLEANKSPDESIMSKIKAMHEKITDLSDAVNMYQRNLEESEQEKRKSAELMAAQSEQLASYEDAFAGMEKEISELKETMETMVEEDSYIAALDKYHNAKALLKEAKGVISDQDAQIRSLTEQVQVLEQERKLQHSRLKLSAKTYKNVQDQLLRAQDEVNILTLELDSKTREMASVERGLTRAQASSYTGRCDDQPDYQKISHSDLGVKLREMSKNLSRV